MENDPFMLAAEHVMNGAAAADTTLETLVAHVNIWWAEDNYALRI